MTFYFNYIQIYSFHITYLFFFLFKRINWKLYYWKHFNFFVKDSFFVSFLKKKHVPVFVELTVILKIVIPIKQSVYLFTKHEIQLQIICGLFITLITRCQTLRFWWPLKILLKSVQKVQIVTLPFVDCKQGKSLKTSKCIIHYKC